MNEFKNIRDNNDNRLIKDIGEQADNLDFKKLADLKEKGNEFLKAIENDPKAKEFLKSQDFKNN